MKKCWSTWLGDRSRNKVVDFTIYVAFGIFTLLWNSVFLPLVFLRSVFLRSVFLHSVFLHLVFLHLVFLQSVFLCSVFLCSVFLHSVFLRSVFLCSVFLRSVFLRNTLLSGLIFRQYILLFFRSTLIWINKRSYFLSFSYSYVCINIPYNIEWVTELLIYSYFSLLI